MRDLTAEEVRVLGCLIEKQRTTPDQYPLTLNALRNACNQTTNRDPVVDYSEDTIRRALERLIHRGWVRNASWAGSRAMKYRHLLDKQLNLDERSLALLAVLMLRGPQTAAELRQRSERLYRFASPEEVEQVLAELTARDLVAQLPRRPGERGRRYVHLLGAQFSVSGDLASDRSARNHDGAASMSGPRGEPRSSTGVGAVASADTAATSLAERVAALERRIADLERKLNELAG